MNLNRNSLWVLGTALFLQACQQENIASTRAMPSGTEFDPAVVNALHSYNLSPADLASVQAGVAPNEQFSGQVAQKSVTIGAERIVYFETSGKGPDILMIHGNGQSSNAFSQQLRSPLGAIFHIIAIDLPGHGLSARSPNPSVTYQIPGLASVVVGVQKKLKMEDAVIVGWSLGGNLLFEVADQLTHVPGLMVIGAPPVANPFDPRAFLPSPVASLLFQQDLTEDQIQAIVPAFFKPNARNIPAVFFQDLRVQDPLVRLNLGISLATGNYKDQLEVVRKLTVPLAVVEGEQEQLTSIAYLQSLTIPTLFHNRLWLIPNAGHIAQFENPDYFNVLLAAFVIESNLSHKKTTT